MLSTMFLVHWRSTLVGIAAGLMTAGAAFAARDMLTTPQVIAIVCIGAATALRGIVGADAAVVTPGGAS